MPSFKLIDATIFNPDEDTYSEILLGAVNEDMKPARAAMRYHIAGYDNPELVSGSDLDSMLGHFPNTSSTIYPNSVAKSYRRRKRAPHRNPVLLRKKVLVQQVKESTSKAPLAILYEWLNEHGLLSNHTYNSGD